MRIGIDGRKITDFGIGTYIRGLLRGLTECRGETDDPLLAVNDVVGKAPQGDTVPSALRALASCCTR